MPLSIDVRGMMADEAVMEVDRYIDSAFISGLNESDRDPRQGNGRAEKRDRRKSLKRISV